MQKMTPKEIENKKKYLKPPSWQQLEKFISDLDVPYAQFERFFGLGHGYVIKVRCGYRNLPVALWHYIYEGRVPSYGLKSSPPAEYPTNYPKKRHTKAAIKAAGGKKNINTDVFANRFGQ